ARRQQLEAAASYPIEWLEERSGLIGGLRYFLFRKVPGDTNWFHTLGSATLTAFLVQAVTGVILALYYKPAPNSASESIPNASILRGGAEIGPDTLARFYSLHMLVIPGAIFALIGLHLYLVIRLGVTSPPWSKEAAGADWVEVEEEPVTARAGLVQPAPRGK